MKSCLCGRLTREPGRQFNLTSYLADTPLPPSPTLPQRDILQNIQNGANSLLAVAATRVSDVAGHVQSAVSSAAASLPQIEDYLPLNCTIGTEQFCVGYRNTQNLSCSHSPFELSALLPDAVQDLPGPVEDALRERMGDLLPLADDLSNLTASLNTCLIVGLISIIFVAVFACCLVCDTWISRKMGTVARLLIYLCVAVVCCAPYSALVTLHVKVMKGAQRLPVWVEVQKGEVMGLSIGLLVCAVIFVVLAAVASSPKVVQWTSNSLRVRRNVPVRRLAT